MSMCNDFFCPNRNVYSGYCKLTICDRKSVASKSHISRANNKETLIFPQTIGDMTFYSKQELFEWVITQQNINKNPDYGIGRYS